MNICFEYFTFYIKPILRGTFLRKTIKANCLRFRLNIHFFIFITLTEAHHFFWFLERLQGFYQNMNSIVMIFSRIFFVEFDRLYHICYKIAIQYLRYYKSILYIFTYIIYFNSTILFSSFFGKKMISFIIMQFHYFFWKKTVYRFFILIKKILQLCSQRGFAMIFSYFNRQL